MPAGVAMKKTMPDKFRALCLEREPKGGPYKSIEPEFQTKEEAIEFAKSVDREKFFEPHVQEHIGGGMWRDV
jgi:hypothetical protein